MKKSALYKSIGLVFYTCFFSVQAGDLEEHLVEIAEESTIETVRVAMWSGLHNDYLTKLTHLVLAASDKKPEVNFIGVNYPVPRMVASIKKKEFDVRFFASDNFVDTNLLPVRIDVLNGLLGKRVLLIKKESQVQFSHINTCDQLRKKTFGQGESWPDMKILRYNGFKVITSTRYQNLFGMLHAGRFDAFPRGVFEPWEELRIHKDKNLVVEEKFVIEYFLPVYFYVAKDNTHLANIINQGFQRIIENGQFDTLVREHPLLKKMHANLDLSGRIVCKLEIPPKNEKY